MPVVHPQKHRRIERRHPQRLLQGQAERVDAEADSRRHVEMGAGQHRLVVLAGPGQALAVTLDEALAQPERGLDRPHGRHGVGHQEQPARRAFGAPGDPQGGGVDMEAVGNDPAPHRAGVEGCADHAGSAALQGAHGVEEMRGAGGTGLDHGHRLFIGRVGVAEAHDRAARDQAADLAGRDLPGGHGHQQPGDFGRQHRRDVGIGHRPHEALIVDALAGRREVRSFEMKSCDAGSGLADRGQCCPGRLGGGRDQGRQQPAGPEGTMGGGDAVHGGRRRGVVQQ